MDWTTIGTVLGSTITAVGGLDFFKWWFNRRSEARKAAEEALDTKVKTDADELQTLKDAFIFLQSQLKGREQRFADVWDAYYKTQTALFDERLRRHEAECRASGNAYIVKDCGSLTTTALPLTWGNPQKTEKNEKDGED